MGETLPTDFNRPPDTKNGQLTEVKVDFKNNPNLHEIDDFSDLKTSMDPRM